MPSITSWMRLEPRSRDAEMSTTLQARIYDPLWMLARQWQFGEFQGEDNGSPVIARWNGESAPLTRYFAGPIDPDTPQIRAPKYDPHMPLETLVERETVRPPVEQTPPPEKLRLAAESGQHFLRILDQQEIARDFLDKYRDAFIREFSFLPEQRAALDPDSRAFFDLVATRVPDGRRLFAAFSTTSGGEIVIPPALGVERTDAAEVRQAARLWLRWYESLFSEPEANEASWLPERMEYAFSVATGFSDGERVLTAPEYYEGHLDWYAFDANPKVKLGGATDQSFTSITRTAIPAPASFRGMPAARFWEFEDAQVNLASADAGPTDLLRMLLIEFAVDYGNDWFVIPVELDIGSLYRSRSLIITDTFGVRTLIQSASELREPFSTWRMFQHSHLRGSGPAEPAANLFFLPPSLVKSLESRPIEEVLFLRDEMSNMAWGVERVIESAAEFALNRSDQPRGEQAPTPIAKKTAANELTYRLSTDVPDNWVPLVPVKRETGLRLERGKVLRVDETWGFVEAHGRILNPDGDRSGGARPGGDRLALFEEEIPREGVRVTRSYQLARWHDGSTHLWVGRRKRVGRGEGSSGLRFDTLT